MSACHISLKGVFQVNSVVRLLAQAMKLGPSVTAFCEMVIDISKVSSGCLNNYIKDELVCVPTILGGVYCATFRFMEYYLTGR